MPSLTNYAPYVCAHCGDYATFISIHSKIPRCKSLINQCPAIIEKQIASRLKTMGGAEGMRAHMKKMSDKGNASTKRLTKEYKENVGKKISAACFTDGVSRIAGENNPNYGGKYTNDPDIRDKMKKPKRDSSNIGRWERTAEHRDAISERISKSRPSYSRTSIELSFAALLDKNSIEYKQEFLIQSKNHRDYEKLFYRHVYDFFIPSLNLIVECDGEYWHGTVDAMKNDTKASYIANELGFRVLRISESELKSIECYEDHILRILTEGPAFAVFGNFYKTIPTREFLRNPSPKII